MKRVQHVKVSGAITYFRDKFKKQYGLLDYDIYQNINDITLFVGLYTQIDYDVLKDHRGGGIVMFLGSDANYDGLITANKSILKRYKVFSGSSCIQRRLEKLGVESVLSLIVPSGVIEMDYRDRSNAEFVYFYGTGRTYGEEHLKLIQSKTNHKIIIANSHKTFPNIKDIYEHCFVGMRLTPLDGMGATVIEMGLMGRKVIYNPNPHPNALKWNTIDDIVNHINTEYENRHLNYEYLAKEVYDYIDKTDNWLYL